MVGGAQRHGFVQSVHITSINMSLSTDVSSY